MVLASVLAFSLGGMGWTEILLILAILVLFFGASRIPGIARGLGQSVSEFKKGKDEGKAGSETKNPKKS